MGLGMSSSEPVSDSSRSNVDVLELSLVNDLRELPRVAAAIAEFCTDRDLGTQLSYAVDLSVDEILNASIASAYDDEEVHPIEVAVYLDAEEIMVLIVNDGSEWSAKQPSNDRDRSILDEEHLDDLGLFLVHQVMDHVTHERQQGCNIVIMTKRLPSDEPESHES